MEVVSHGIGTRIVVLNKRTTVKEILKEISYVDVLVLVDVNRPKLERAFLKLPKYGPYEKSVEKIKLDLVQRGSHREMYWCGHCGVIDSWEEDCKCGSVRQNPQLWGRTMALLCQKSGLETAKKALG